LHSKAFKPGQATVIFQPVSGFTPIFAAERTAYSCLRGKKINSSTDKDRHENFRIGNICAYIDNLIAQEPAQAELWTQSTLN
jgi:hypothetical protein